jgi:hypothetical protein
MSWADEARRTIAQQDEEKMRREAEQGAKFATAIEQLLPAGVELLNPASAEVNSGKWRGLIDLGEGVRFELHVKRVPTSSQYLWDISVYGPVARIDIWYASHSSFAAPRVREYANALISEVPSSSNNVEMAKLLLQAWHNYDNRRKA